jgi:hypothetical protein
LPCRQIAAALTLLPLRCPPFCALSASFHYFIAAFDIRLMPFSIFFISLQPAAFLHYLLTAAFAASLPPIFFHYYELHATLPA